MRLLKLSIKTRDGWVVSVDTQNTELRGCRGLVKQRRPTIQAKLHIAKVYDIIKQALVAKTDTKYQLRFVKICKNYYYHWMNGKCKITRGLICRLPRETTGRTPGAYGTAQTKVRKAQKDVNSRCWRGKMHSIDNDDALATQKTSVFYLTLAVDWCLSWAQVMH